MEMNRKREEFVDNYYYYLLQAFQHHHVIRVVSEVQINLNFCVYIIAMKI